MVNQSRCSGGSEERPQFAWSHKVRRSYETPLQERVGPRQRSGVVSGQDGPGPAPAKSQHVKKPQKFLANRCQLIYKDRRSPHLRYVRSYESVHSWTPLFRQSMAKNGFFAFFWQLFLPFTVSEPPRVLNQ